MIENRAGFIGEAIADRHRSARRGRWLQSLTIAWNSAECIVALIAGFLAGSVALVGFGFDSAIEVTSSLAALWRLHRDADEGRREATERRALHVPVLVHAKRRIAKRLDSRALEAETRQTEICAYLSAILLAGLALNAALGWWWADPLSALAMVPFIAHEAWEILLCLRPQHARRADRCRYSRSVDGRAAEPEPHTRTLMRRTA